MTILLLILLAISFLCAVTLVGACMVSGRSRDYSEEVMTSEEYDEQPAVNPTVPALHTTTHTTS